METTDNQSGRKNRRAVQASTTLSRKYARRPAMRGEGPARNVRVSVGRSPEIQRFRRVEQFSDMTASGQMEDLVMEGLMGSSMDDEMMGMSYETDSKVIGQKQGQTQKVNVMVGHPAQKQQRKVSHQITIQQITQATSDRERMQGQMERQMLGDEIAQEKTIGCQVQTSRQRMMESGMRRQNSSQQRTSVGRSMVPVAMHPMYASVNGQMQQRSLRVGEETQRKVSAKELKDQAIRKALASANKVSEEETKGKSRKNRKMQKTMHFGFGRVMLALSCAAAAVAAIVYFVNLNMPDISLRVAAMQTGMDPAYPNYVPRNYSVSGITSKEGEIKIDFINSIENKNFTLTEEKSSWDTNALLTNFVKKEYGEDYTIVREQGLTIYINESRAAWVNGGNVYKIDAEVGTLTNKQIKSIAVSL